MKHQNCKKRRNGMKKTTFWLRFGSLAAALLLCLPLWGCRAEVATEERPYCRLNGQDFFFFTQEEKAAWEEPLCRLLANVLVPYGERGDILGYRAPDPDAPAIPQSHACGLFDVTGDGVPELWVVPMGSIGSSGLCFYELYDLQTGAFLGYSEGADWCLYYDPEDQTVTPMAQYEWRCGWDQRMRAVSIMTQSEEKQGYDVRRYLQIIHTINGELINTEPVSPEGDLILGEWVETYLDTTYLIDNTEVYLSDWYSEYDRLTHRLRLPDTALQVLRWRDVTDHPDDYALRARHMAQALLSSKQCFLKA